MGHSGWNIRLPQRKKQDGSNFFHKDTYQSHCYTNELSKIRPDLHMKVSTFKIENMCITAVHTLLFNEFFLWTINKGLC